MLIPAKQIQLVYCFNYWRPLFGTRMASQNPVRNCMKIGRSDCIALILSVVLVSFLYTGCSPSSDQAHDPDAPRPGELVVHASEPVIDPVTVELTKVDAESGGAKAAQRARYPHHMFRGLHGRVGLRGLPRRILAPRHAVPREIWQHAGLKVAPKTRPFAGRTVDRGILPASQRQHRRQ